MVFRLLCCLLISDVEQTEMLNTLSVDRRLGAMKNGSQLKESTCKVKIYAAQRRCLLNYNISLSDFY